MMLRSTLFVVLGLALAPLGAAHAQRPPSEPGATSPELARLGPAPVGVRTVRLVDKARIDVERFDPATGKAPSAERALEVTVWHPATAAAGPAEHYPGVLPTSNPGGGPLAVSTPGLARRGAPPARGPFPLVVLSHGFGGYPGVVSWLGENLASKGYVVAAPAHRDPPFSQPLALAPALLHRPLDQALVARELQRLARTGEGPWRGLIDPERVALVGYSMGGYGALRAAGATFNPEGAPAAYVPGRLLAPHVRGGAGAGEGPLIPGLKAAVLIAPWGGQATYRAFGAEDLKGVTVPLLFLVGDRDDISGYEDGVRTLFEGAVSAPRRMLVFENGGHTIGTGPAPEAARGRLVTEAYFEDPVWRKDRVLGISQHFITAFLDLHLKGDASKAAYLDPPTERSAEGVWPTVAGADEAAMSGGQDGVTVWRGFQRRWAEGLRLLRGEPSPPARR